ncbi:MAG: L-2-amino-thiazoline-4-carboxylic acid hydrolase [Myxococcales bacterium]|nr:MAG: L-2-amino-thiazoline-4-carboxylic acid hydrolase [Myxococcales bacterium]
MMRLLKPWLLIHTRPVLAQRFGRARAKQILEQAFGRYRTSASNLRKEASMGGNVMVHCAALTAELYHVLLVEGLDEQQARAQTAKVTAVIYDKMAKLPWLIARISARSPIARLKRATTIFRKFPFSPPAYLMQDVPSDKQSVAFDVKRCPVAEYFKQQGLPELCAESFCSLDFSLAEKWGAQLERSTTLAAGDACCDFRWRLKPIEKERIPKKRRGLYKSPFVRRKNLHDPFRFCSTALLTGKRSSIFDALTKHGMISPQDRALFRFADSPVEAFSFLKEGLSEAMEATSPAFASTVTCSAHLEQKCAHAAADCCGPTAPIQKVNT